MVGGLQGCLFTGIPGRMGRGLEAAGGQPPAAHQMFAAEKQRGCPRTELSGGNEIGSRALREAVKGFPT